jgi:hypothetical protein
MFDNFDIDWDRTKFHYPLDEHSSAGGFISYNYVVKLKEQRTSLPEYADLADLWCEIQVQTTIDHAWSEMHHDTVYKPPAKGFGGAVLKEVETRMARIMQDYLVPAGFDFQKVSNDVRRLEDARTFFETRPLERVEADIDNNERHDILKRYRETVLPYVDDLTGQAETIRNALRASLEKAASTETVPIYYGTYEHAGKTFEDVLEATLDIVDRLRFADEQGVRATWDLIGQAVDLASTEAARARAGGSAKSLGKHNLHVWKQVGPLVQCQLAELALADVGSPGRRPLVIAAAQAILDPEVEGTTSGSNTITIHQGAVLPSGELAHARGQSIAALEAILTEPLPPDAKEAFNALMSATSFPYHGTVDGALVELIATDTLRVVEIASRLAPLAPSFGSAPSRCRRTFSFSTQPHRLCCPARTRTRFLRWWSTLLALSTPTRRRSPLRFCRAFAHLRPCAFTAGSIGCGSFGKRNTSLSSPRLRLTSCSISPRKSRPLAPMQNGGSAPSRQSGRRRLSVGSKPGS